MSSPVFGSGYPFACCPVEQWIFTYDGFCACFVSRWTASSFIHASIRAGSGWVNSVVPFSVAR